MGFEFRDPWFRIGNDRGLAKNLENELRDELDVRHPLHGIRFAAIAKHEGCDDVLYQFLDGSTRVAVVHLTWARHPEPPPWPIAEIFPSIEDWTEQLNTT